MKNINMLFLYFIYLKAFKLMTFLVSFRKEEGMSA